MRNKMMAWYPPSLAEFITTHGFLRFHDGLFSLCNPDEFRPILSLVFGDDKDFHDDECHVVGYSAFGVLECWSEKLANFTISLPEAAIFSRALTIANWAPIASRDHLASGAIPDKAQADFLDSPGEPMFDRCVKKLGSLNEGECYGFVPALAFGGIYGPTRTVDHIKRLSALEHFTILAQLEQFKLVAVTVDALRVVRPIG
jgi:hypothetical protein